MAKGTTFGDIHSSTNLHLIQQKVEVQPAKPKTYYVAIPGGDGSKDLTEALGVGVNYSDREITWTFALYPLANWYNKQKEVNDALNGVACHIILDDDPNYYYEGRLTVTGHKSDKLKRTITVKATCRPYKLKNQQTSVSRSNLSTTYQDIVLANERKPVTPSITVSQATTLQFGDTTYSLAAAGTYQPAGLRLMPGNNTLKAKIASGSSGLITIAYREGAL